MSWGETVISASFERRGMSTRLLASRRPMRKRAPGVIPSAFVEQPGDGGAKLGDAGARARRGRQRLGVSGGMLGQRRFDRGEDGGQLWRLDAVGLRQHDLVVDRRLDRKSTRLNSSHLGISYAVFCL